MIIDRLCQEHRNIEKLLLVLERELSVFDRGERPDYEVISAVIAMEEQDFFPAAVKALQPEDWAEIASSRLTGLNDPLFSETAEKRFDAVRWHILQLEQEAETERARAH